MRTVSGHLGLEALHMGCFLGVVLTSRIPENGSSVNDWMMYTIRGMLASACSAMAMFHLWAILVRKGIRGEHSGGGKMLGKLVWSELLAYMGVLIIMSCIYIVGLMGAIWIGNQPFCQYLVDIILRWLRLPYQTAFPTVLASWSDSIYHLANTFAKDYPWTLTVKETLVKLTKQTFVLTTILWSYLQGPELWYDFRNKTGMLISTMITDLERPHYIALGSVISLLISITISTFVCLAVVWLTARPATKFATDLAAVHPKSFSLASIIGVTTFMGIFGAEAFLHFLQAYGQYLWGSEYQKAVRVHRFIQNDQERALTYIASILTAIVTAIALVRVPTVPSPPQHSHYSLKGS